MVRNKSTQIGSNVQRVVHTMASASQETASAAQGGQKYFVPLNPLNSHQYLCMWPWPLYTSFQVKQPPQRCFQNQLSVLWLQILLTHLLTSSPNKHNMPSSWLLHSFYQKIPLHGTGQCFPSQGSSAVVGWRGVSLPGLGTTVSIHVTPAWTILQANWS